MVDGFAKGVKFAMLIANGVIFAGGITVFSIGVWTLSDKSFMERLLGTKSYIASASILIGTGVVVAIISFLGSIGAWKEIRSVLITFFFILAMIFLTMLTGGILGYIFRSEVDERMHSEMIMTVKLYGNDTKVTESWDAVHRNFNCCGVIPNIANPKVGRDQKAYKIWMRNVNFRLSGPQVPESCCKNPLEPQQRKACVRDKLEERFVFMDDCYEKMKEFVKAHALIVGGIGVGIAVLLIFGMILSLALYLVIE
ncbi:CD151 antigen [Tetranychus urticae]|uniref:CD151 antigen n=1 Tax=Tetranychus urticae TaxID=32264 RepID=UPI00077BFD7C|nr:CD151 antigen [Tetranychus urticae]